MKKIDNITLNNVIEITLATGHKIYLSSDIYAESTSEEWIYNTDGTKDKIMLQTFTCCADDNMPSLYDSVDIEIIAKYLPNILIK